jgi:hypothetical protein
MRIWYGAGGLGGRPCLCKFLCEFVPAESDTNVRQDAVGKGADARFPSEVRQIVVSGIGWGLLREQEVADSIPVAQIG